MIVTCPNCKTQFEPEAAIAQSVKDELTKEYNQKWTDLARQKDEQYRVEKEQLKQLQDERELQWRQQQTELSRKAEEQKKQMELSLRKELSAKAEADVEHKLRLLEDTNKNNEAKLKEAREKELNFLRKEQELTTREQELELEMQRKMMEERNKLAESVRKEAEEKSRLQEAGYQQKMAETTRKLEEISRQKEEQLKIREEQILMQQQQNELKWKQLQAEQSHKLEEEKKGLEERLTIELAAKVGADFEHKLRLLEDANKTNETKLSEARDKEMDFLKKMQELKTREQELELEMQRKMLDERNKLSEIIKKEEDEKNKLRDEEFQMRLREKDKQLEDQRKLVEEMKRKSEQVSMQLQGEVQELALEELLRYSFPFDVVSEVGKGVRGADCIQTVRNNFGQECGKIIFESKRTKDFSADWIEKLKADMRVLGASEAVIVTQAMPKDMSTFGERDGIWICTFSEARSLVYVLRDLILQVYSAKKSEESKGDKMTLLYNYFVGSEFSEQWKAIREGFMGMKMSIQRERDQMEKMWKAREKQLDKVLLNAAHFKGSIEGIAGMDVDLNLLPEGDNFLLE